ncbi:hypothetical protein AWJ20_530 [Sugiyamaella lignohabitans]|uniref:NAD(P)-binding protein n=1 Tax=Sugiyamaella lignohabitans TaxID=796027 RepID=A0A167CZ38_9ASCO|nr:uncharacterized protein AWJ20_530 [Sugiyamaella lignohabitans]ANB12281.1 hypothetical protein AWJ20_530 [Sugiyamaella lignohabitans]
MSSPSSSSSNTVYFVSGGNRGIGLALVKNLSSIADSVVITTARAPATASDLQDWQKVHSNVHVLKYDAAVHSDATNLASQIEKLVGGIDVFVANSGISEEPMTVLDTPVESWARLYAINTLGPIVLFKALYPLLVKRDTRKVVFISSGLGSQKNMSDAFGTSSYGQSKSALNFTAKELSLELAKQNFIVVPVHPGLVNTDMGSGYVDNLGKNSGEFADVLRSNVMISTDQSAAGIANVITTLSTQDNGIFLSYDRSSLEW